MSAPSPKKKSSSPRKATKSPRKSAKTPRNTAFQPDLDLQLTVSRSFSAPSRAVALTEVEGPDPVVDEEITRLEMMVRELRAERLELTSVHGALETTTAAEQQGSAAAKDEDLADLQELQALKRAQEAQLAMIEAKCQEQEQRVLEKSLKNAASSALPSNELDLIDPPASSNIDDGDDDDDGVVPVGDARGGGLRTADFTAGTLEQNLMRLNTGTAALPDGPDLDALSNQYYMAYMRSQQEKNKRQKAGKTVPKPFKLSTSRVSISKEKFDAYLAEKTQEEEDHLHVKFKARDIPDHVMERIKERELEGLMARAEAQIVNEELLKTMDLGEDRDQLVQAALEGDHDTVNAKFMELTGMSLQDSESVKGRQRGVGTASIVFNDTTTASVGPLAPQYSGARRSYRPEEAPKFKAREVPWATKVKMFDMITQQEEEGRRARMALRAEGLSRSASLPPRMERHHRTKGVIQEIKRKQKMVDDGKSGTLTQDHTFQPAINQGVPDFDKEREQFLRSLHTSRQVKAPTRTSEFKLSASNMRPEKRAPKAVPKRPASSRPIKTTAATTTTTTTTKTKTKTTTANQRGKVVSKKKTLTVASTKKMDEMRALRERRAKEAQAKAAREESILKTKQREARYLKQRLAGNTTGGLAALHDKIRTETESKRQSDKERAEDFKKSREAMREKVKDRPLLVEGDRIQKERAAARRKALLKIKESLDKNGVRNYSKYFDRDELEELGLDM